MRIIITEEFDVLKVEGQDASLDKICMTTLKVYMQSVGLSKREHSDDCDCKSQSFHNEVSEAIEKIVKSFQSKLSDKDIKIKEMFDETKKSE